MRLVRSILVLQYANALDLGLVFGKKSGLSGLQINTQKSYRLSHADRIRQLLSVASQTERRSQRHRDKDKCEDRCMVHPINRYSCGKSRSRDTCSDKNCCWDPNADMCYKQVWEHCPRDRCESIHPDDRASCSTLGGNKNYGIEKCENAGCCYDSYNRQCYDSNPGPTKPEPDTAECREVKPSNRESCGFGLAQEACGAMTGCCWRIDKDSISFCYKSAIYESANNATNSKPLNSANTVVLTVAELEPEYPVVHLKMANSKQALFIENDADDIVPGDKAKKFQLWMSYISALTSRIEVACQRKTQPIDCIKRAANVLLVAKDEMLKSNYGLQFAHNEVQAREMLEGINDVLTWFCLNHPIARFCRTLVLSGFTLSQIDQTSNALINEANTRFSAMLKLGEYGMLGEYQPKSRTNETMKRFGTDCSNTFLLMQTYEESLAEVQSKSATNSHSCILSGGCWKKMSLRTAIVDLYGEYSRVSKAYFVTIWREAMSPLLSPPEQPLLTQISCIEPIPKVFERARDLFDARLDFRVEVEVPKKAGVQ